MRPGPPMAMGMPYPAGPAAFYPQGMLPQPAFASIAGYMAPAPMGGAYPVAYAAYPGGVPQPMPAAYAAAPMAAYGGAAAAAAHMQHMAAAGAHVASHGAPWGAPLQGRPPPPPPQPPHGPPPAAAGKEQQATSKC